MELLINLMVLGVFAFAGMSIFSLLFKQNSLLGMAGSGSSSLLGGSVLSWTNVQNYVITPASNGEISALFLVFVWFIFLIVLVLNVTKYWSNSNALWQ